MDKAALQDLFSYTGWAWDQIKAAVPDDKMLRAVAPGSGWPALRNCLAHIVLAYERWVPAIAHLESQALPDLAADDFLSWPQIDAHRRRTRHPLRSNPISKHGQTPTFANDTRLTSTASVFSTAGAN